jgi:2-polyprenyl-3-methyl-5-hydroxy-6-metoxy-1,4-benzoquinol methylase
MKDAYEGVFAGAYPDAVPSGMTFECVVFNDVLEHMENPWRALELAHGFLAPGGVIVASIPNIRNIRTLFDLVVRGRWEYSDTGVLDRTHLRFFTRREMIALFESQGYVIERIDPINIPKAGKRGVVARAFGRLGREIAAEQYGIVAIDPRQD